MSDQEFIDENTANDKKFKVFVGGIPVSLSDGTFLSNKK